jgi:hypothetical protein
MDLRADILVAEIVRGRWGERFPEGVILAVEE